MKETQDLTAAEARARSQTPGTNAVLAHTAGRERSILAIAISLWAAYSSIYLAPEFGSTDVYLFRDAAINLAHGRGFATASFEHSLSFVPLLYSTYTPASLWIFSLFSAATQNAQSAATIFNLAITAFTIWVVFEILASTLPRGRRRIALVLLLVTAIPSGIVGAQSERPEALSFLGLLFLLRTLRDERPNFLLGGAVGGLLFLIQPFAGVLSALFIAACAITLTQRKNNSHPLLTAAKKVLVAGLAFTLPVAITAGAFQLRDPASLERFKSQATAGGLTRNTGYAANGKAGTVGGTTNRPLLSRYTSAIRWILTLGPIALAQFTAWLSAVAFWVLLLLSAKSDRSGIAALFTVGFITIILPFLLFPLQGNYLLLGRAILPFALLANFLGTREVLRHALAPLLLLTINLVALLPQTCLSIVTRTETTPTFHEAENQVAKLKRYLADHNETGDIVLAPASHYFLYKTAINNLFNEKYLSHEHDVSRIAAIVNCPTGSSYFDSSSQPLNPLLNGAAWKVLDSVDHQAMIRILGKQVMRKNWTWACTVYVRPETRQ